MAEILKIKAGEEPSGYSTHVLVEEAASGTYRASGACNRTGEVKHFHSRDGRDLASILKAATAWADEHGIHFVHVRLAS